MKLAALLALLILLTAPLYTLLVGTTTPFAEPLSDWLKIFGIAAFAAVRTRFWDGHYRIDPATS
jgi:hypothetical protein